MTSASRRILLCLMVTSMTSLPSITTFARRVRGAIIVDDTKPEGKNRYRSLKDWDKTIQAYRAAYNNDRSVAWRTMDTPARVKAVFIENLRPEQGWEGINIYEAEGKVYIYIVPADRPEKTNRQDKDRSRKKNEH